jgi:hypothetical protein
MALLPPMDRRTIEGIAIVRAADVIVNQPAAAGRRR